MPEPIVKETPRGVVIIQEITEADLTPQQLAAMDDLVEFLVQFFKKNFTASESPAQG